MNRRAMNTIADIVRARADDDRVGLRFEDESWTYARAPRRVRASGPRSCSPTSRPTLPFHVGVLLDNVPEFWMMLGAAAMSGATLVGINPTRRGAELERDLQHTDCALLVTEPGAPRAARGARRCNARRRDLRHRHARVGRRARTAPRVRRSPSVEVAPADVFMLIFTSGTTGAPKAVRISHGKLAGWGSNLAGRFPLTPDDVCYSAMPLFHSNAAVAGYTAPMAAGATTVLRRRFSASGFLPDVRKYGVTFFNYVGKPLTYILETPAQPDDADSTAAHRIRQRSRAARHRPVRGALRLLRGGRLRLHRGRHQHVEDRRHAARFAGHADSGIPRRDLRLRIPASSARARSSTSTVACSTPKKPSARW